MERAADRLDGVEADAAAAVRARSLSEHAGPLDLACSLNPKMVRTPALEFLSAELERAITVPGTRLIVSFSPQEGKTSLTRAAVLRALQRNPDCRVAVASYAADLARTSSLAVRQMIESHGTGAVDESSGQPEPDRLGLAIAPDQGAAGGWRLRGHEGGTIARGVGSGMTGRPVDLLAVDDPIKDARDADSATIRGRLHDWWTSVSETRLSPTASVVVVATRWHEQDLSGWLIDNDTTGEWRVVNIPALSDGQTLDALGRPPGEWMVSARGRTVEQWEAIRRRVGERTFSALYQGRPAPLAGGVFQSSWFDTWRVDTVPVGCLPPTVVVDPADNEGDGDEAGIILATTHPESGKVYMLDDLSAPMTVARWARVALLTCARREAPTLAYEKSLSQLPKRIREAWTILRQQAVALRKAKGDPVAALARLSRTDDSTEAREQIAAQLAEIAADVDAVLAIPDAGPRLRPIVARGSKQLRMQLAAPMFETGRAVVVGRLPALEHQLSTWSPGQDSPDRADAATHAVLTAQTVATSVSRSTGRVPTSSTGRARTPVRSTGRGRR